MRRPSLGHSITASLLVATVTLTGSVPVRSDEPQAGSGDPPAASLDERPAPATARRTPLVELIERVAPSVVNISTLVGRGGGSTIVEGTGSILNESGHVITANHVLAARRPTRVTLHDGRVCQYRIIATLPYTTNVQDREKLNDLSEPFRLVAASSRTERIWP